MWTSTAVILTLFVWICNCEVQWEMLGNNICYGARRGTYGTIKLEKEGFLFALKFEHVSGYLTCDRGRNTYYASNWGCHADGDRNGITNKDIGTFLTDESDEIIFPAGAKELSQWQENPYYRLPGYKGDSKDLVMACHCSPMYARVGQELRIWYGEALFNRMIRSRRYDERDNGGQHCINIYAKFGGL